MAINLEASLNSVNAQFINIDQDREAYTAHYEKLRNNLYSIWKKEEKILGKLLNGHTLGGSYGDNLKVTRPNEFDLVIHLKFPENDHFIVKPDPRKPGNVILDMTLVMARLQPQKQNQDIYLQIQKIVNAKNLLLEDKLQSWLHSLVKTALNKMDNQIEVDGKISKLVYKKSGPAHTIFVSEPYEYSVDFVPAIRLNADQNILKGEQKEYFKGIKYWDAVPKPIKGVQTGNISFRASYYEAEHKLLENKQNLKNAIRFMKKFRDTKQNLGNLKSYYIKTLFLWQLTIKPSQYWYKSVPEILIDMFSELGKCLETKKRNGKLLFFWDINLDMFAELTPNQRKDMYNCVVGSEYILKRGAGNLTDDIQMNVTSSFSNRQERGLMNNFTNKKEDQTNSSLKPQGLEKVEKSLRTLVLDSLGDLLQTKPISSEIETPSISQKKTVLSEATPKQQSKPTGKTDENDGKPKTQLTESKSKVKSVSIEESAKNGAKPKQVPVQNGPKPHPELQAKTKSNVKSTQLTTDHSKVQPKTKAPCKSPNQLQGEPKPKAKSRPELQTETKSQVKVNPIDKPTEITGKTKTQLTTATAKAEIQVKPKSNVSTLPNPSENGGKPNTGSKTPQNE